jgi:hypothetical protein
MPFFDPVAPVNDDGCPDRQEALDLPFGRQLHLRGDVAEHGGDAEGMLGSPLPAPHR